MSSYLSFWMRDLHQKYAVIMFGVCTALVAAMHNSCMRNKSSLPLLFVDGNVCKIFSPPLIIIILRKSWRRGEMSDYFSSFYFPLSIVFIENIIYWSDCNNSKIYFIIQNLSDDIFWTIQSFLNLNKLYLWMKIVMKIT